MTVEMRFLVVGSAAGLIGAVCLMAVAASAQSPLANEAPKQQGKPPAPKANQGAKPPGGSGAKSQSPEAAKVREAEDQLWLRAIAAGNVEEFEAYLRVYPSGRYADAARAEIQRLRPPFVMPPSGTYQPQPSEEAVRAAREAQEAHDKAMKQHGYVSQWVDAVSSKHGLVEWFDSTMLAPLLLPTSTSLDLTEGKGMFAASGPSTFGNPESMVARAAQLQQERNRQTAALSAAR